MEQITPQLAKEFAVALAICAENVDFADCKGVGPITVKDIENLKSGKLDPWQKDPTVRVRKAFLRVFGGDPNYISWDRAGEFFLEKAKREKPEIFAAKLKALNENFNSSAIPPSKANSESIFPHINKMDDKKLFLAFKNVCEDLEKDQSKISGEELAAFCQEIKQREESEQDLFAAACVLTHLNFSFDTLDADNAEQSRKKAAKFILRELEILEEKLEKSRNRAILDHYLSEEGPIKARLNSTIQKIKPSNTATIAPVRQSLQ